MKLLHSETGHVIADNIICAYSFIYRLKGLMFTRTFPHGGALHLKPCQSIHTFFMNYPIDAVFLDQDENVVAVLEHMKPKKVSKVYRQSYSVVELPAGTARSYGIVKGKKLNFEN